MVLTTILYLLLPLLGNSAADLNQELDRIREAMVTSDKLYLDVTYQYYKADQEEGSPLSTQKASLYWDGSKVVQQISGVTLIGQGNQVLVVDESSQTMVVRETNIKIDSLLIPSNLLSQIKEAEKKELPTDKQDWKGMQIDFSHAQMYRLDLFYDQKSYEIRKMRMYGLASEYQPEKHTDTVYEYRMDVSYTYLQAPQPELKEISMSRYVSHKEGTYRLTPAFSDYTLIDQTRED